MIALLAFTRSIDAFLSILRRTTSVVVAPFVSLFESQWRLLHKWAQRSLMSPEEED